MERLRRFYRVPLLVGVFVLGLLLLSTLLPMVSVVDQRGTRWLRNLIRFFWYRAVSRVLSVRLHARGVPYRGPCLVVSNHISWLDIVVLGCIMPLDFVAKQEIADWPVLGFMGRRAGNLFVRRGDRKSTQATAEGMVWRLRRGDSVGLFPEGTSSTGECLLRFHSRLFQPAILVGVPIQPVAITYLGNSKLFAPFVGEDELLPHLWRLLGLKTIEVELVFCPPLAASRGDRNLLAQTAHLEIARALGLPESMDQSMADQTAP